LIIPIILSFLLSFNNITQNNNISKDSELQIRSSSPILPFIVGVAYGPKDLDPIYAWDYNAFNIIDQVVEGLFAYNLSAPDLALIPRLASAMGTWNTRGDEYTVPLRTDVKFHDGTDFNASAVVAHWDRMAWALNTTGTNTGYVTQLKTLYRFPNGTAIVKKVVDNTDDTVTFFLNGSYVPFEALLAFPGSYIQSPTYTDTLTDYIDTDTGVIVGTGPFVYDSYEATVEVLLHAFDDYWKGKANITELVFKLISDQSARDTALLNGDIHFLSNPSLSMLDTFKVNPNIAVLDSGKKSATLYYIGMNNMRINRTFRESISYAVNYSHIIEKLMSGTVDRLKSPIPEGIMFSNTTFNVPILNLTHARLVMQSMGFGVGLGLYNDNDWINQEVTTPLATFNFTYHSGSTIREDLLDLLQDNLAKIGIRVIEDVVATWSNFTDRVLERNGRTRDMLELFFLGWGPDYNDPSNYINTMFTNRTIAYNGVQYNGSRAALEDGRDPFALNDNVQLLMEAALSETDPVQREKYYDRIQELLIEQDYPWAYCYVPKLYHAHHVKLTGFQQNALNKLDFYSCNWELHYIPDSLSITTPDSTSSWETGTSQYIYWNSTGTISNVKIDLYNNSVHELEITANTINNGEFFWTIPLTLDNSTQYQINITDVSNSSICDSSDYFELYTLPSPANTITVISPGSSSSWETSTTHSINWNSTGSIADVLIELYWKGTLNATIFASTPNDGSYSWTIPSGLDNSTQYQIKISDVLNSATYDFSDYFEIYTPPTLPDSITVTNPSGIVAWQIETIHSITWTSTGSIANVQIELYLSGTLESVLTSGTPNAGDFSWTIPSGLANSTFYQIKITDVSNPSTYDYSDNFAIYDPSIISEEIPGYNLYFLFMIIGIISVVLIKKKYKHLKK